MPLGPWNRLVFLQGKTPGRLKPPVRSERPPDTKSGHQSTMIPAVSRETTPGGLDTLPERRSTVELHAEFGGCGPRDASLAASPGGRGGSICPTMAATTSRVAKDLHDGIGQRVTLLIIEAEQLKADSLNRVEMANRIDGLLKQSLEILTHVKTLAHELYSPRLEYLGIAGVMRSFCRDFREQQRVEIDFRSHGLPNFVPLDISLCLFRVLQAALHNAVEHSGVRNFDVQLNGASDEIHLTVGDCGVGFNLEMASKAGGLGLNHMRERLKLVKGTLSIDSQLKRGTTIHARVPLRLGSDSMGAAGYERLGRAFRPFPPVAMRRSHEKRRFADLTIAKFGGNVTCQSSTDKPPALDAQLPRQPIALYRHAP